MPVPWPTWALERSPWPLPYFPPCPRPELSQESLAEAQEEAAYEEDEGGASPRPPETSIEAHLRGVRGGDDDDMELQAAASQVDVSDAEEEKERG